MTYSVCKSFTVHKTFTLKYINWRKFDTLKKYSNIFTQNIGFHKRWIVCALIQAIKKGISIYSITLVYVFSSLPFN